jgi:hypothetical protein
VVGPERITVIALDDADRSMALRVFERLVGLTQETLVTTTDVTNRSMTLPEIEVVRAFNIAFKAQGLSRGLLSRVMHFGAGQYMKSRVPGPDEARVVMPAWAIDRATEIATTMVDAISTSGVRVVGELQRLAERPPDTKERSAGETVSVPPAVAASAAMGVLVAMGLARSPIPTSDPEGVEAGETLVPVALPPMSGEPRELLRVSSAELAWALLARMKARLASPVRALFRPRLDPVSIEQEAPLPAEQRAPVNPG